MKKFTTSILIFLVMISLISCANTKQIVETEASAQVESSAEEIKAYADKILKNMQEVSNAPSKYYSRSEFKKVADNFYEVEYYDYDIDYMLSGPSVVELENMLSAVFDAGCTAVRKDNFYGRNLDFVYGDLAEVLVKVKANENRYGNIAITGGFSYMSPDAIDNQYLDIVSQACLPLMICDGINEKGVVCNVNVVPAGDLETFTKGTNPSGHDLNMYSVPRFVLDKAGSAKEAIELLKDMNIYTPWDACSLNPKGMEFHFMIADKDNTYVVEFVNNEMQVIDLTDDNDKIMTNFYLYYKDNMTPHSSGVERYKKVQEQYENIGTLDDMKKVMESVKFSKCYGDENGDDIWYSDDGFVVSDGTNINFENYEPYIDEIKEIAKGHRDKLIDAVDKKTNPSGYWITMHTSVFDIENKTMDVAIQERYEEGYHRFTIE